MGEVIDPHIRDIALSRADDGAQPDGPPVGDDKLSLLACYSCKRRKVKCNRALPVCSLCEKVGATCEYPTHAEKPGPKAGTPQRNKRRRQGDEDAARPPFGNGADVGDGYAYELAGGGPRLAPYNHPQANLYAPRPPQRRHSLPEVNDAALENGVAPRPGAPTFSQLTYPSHEQHPRTQSPITPEPETGPRQAGHITVETVCEGLKLSTNAYHFLMESYFTNMTSFSLFKPNSIENKLSMMRSRAEAESLVAAMFSFAARFEGGSDYPGRNDEIPAPGYFAHIASQQLDRALNECGDTTPPLWVLQACILVTFYQLTRSVRSRSWRALGSCIRLAYDMQLHVVDANHDRAKAFEGRDINIRQWSHMEERRRAWWAIWEMDVFASTIRRLPTAIDWAQNMTLLPVNDNCWFNDVYQNSTFLSKEPDVRWRCLEKSGNDSPRAWFIVINSLMRNTQLIVYPPGTAMQSPYDRRLETSQADLDIMANCIYCTSLSLPSELQYGGETLDFRTKGSPQDITPRQYHCDKYSIHLMTQLARFIVYHHKICGQAPWNKKASDEENTDSAAGLSDWSNYANAADEIVTAIRHSSKDHYKYVNPFLVNTVWFAAAAQCACKVFGPSTIDKRVAESSLGLLRMTVDRFINFWGSADTLKGKLARMEAGLRSLVARDNAPDGTSNSNEKPRATHETTTQNHNHAQPPATHTTPGAGSDPSQPSYTPAMTDASLAQYGGTPATEASNGYAAPGIDPALTGAASAAPQQQQDYMSNPYDFAQAMAMTDQTGFLSGGGAGSEYFPYGLDELLMYGTATGQFAQVGPAQVAQL